MMDISKIRSPKVRVIWKDSPENFTKEKIKRVEAYFKRKYNAVSVEVVRNEIHDTKESITGVDMTMNLLDNNFQLNVVKEHLAKIGNENTYDAVAEIDAKVEKEISSTKKNPSLFKRWFIEWIEFSNFLSYGENNRLDFNNLNGIVLVESQPENFGGKSTLAVDLPLFLFFGKTSKTSTNEDIFNRYSDSTEVIVKGLVIIDDVKYIIERTLTRTPKKAGGWTVKADLEFQRILPSGEVENLKGEQRRETETFIKEAIGTEDDFMLTILATEENLKDLLDSKATARAQTLSRFLGLDLIKEKEQIAKDLYSKFSKGMLSNLYNIESLEQDNINHAENIKLITETNVGIEENLRKTEEGISKGVQYKDDLLSKKYTDIDKEMLTFNVSAADDEINRLNGNIKKNEDELAKLVIKEPSSFYDETNHEKLKESLSEMERRAAVIASKIHDARSMIEKYATGFKCEGCGKDIVDMTFYKEKVDLEKELLKEQSELLPGIEASKKEEAAMKILETEFKQYERSKLVKANLDIQIETYGLKIKEIELKKDKFNTIQQKIKENRKIDETVIKANLRLDELGRTKNGLLIEKTNNTNKVILLTDTIEGNKKKIEKIHEEAAEERKYQQYLEIFGKNGISKTIMRSMLPLLNSELSKLMETSALFTLKVEMSDTDKVEFVMVNNKTGVAQPARGGSGYEKTISSLALRAVMSKVCSLPKPNIIVFDEIFGGVADVHLELVGTFFTKIKEYFDKIILITHRSLVKQWADQTIKVIKENDISRIG